MQGLRWVQVDLIRVRSSESRERERESNWGEAI